MFLDTLSDAIESIVVQAYPVDEDIGFGVNKRQHDLKEEGRTSCSNEHNICLNYY